MLIFIIIYFISIFKNENSVVKIKSYAGAVESTTKKRKYSDSEAENSVEKKIKYSEESKRSSESEESESEDSDDEEVNFIRQRRTQTQTPKQAVQGFINAILTDEQRAALKRGECFFCHKKGHWYRDCRARKLHIY